MGRDPNEQACNAVAYEQAQQGEAEEAVAWGEKERMRALILLTRPSNFSLRTSSPSVFALILDYDREHSYSRGYFKKIPTDTGGLIEYPPSSSTVPEAMAKLIATLQNTLVVALQPSKPVTKMARLKLDAIGPNGKPQHDIRLLTVAEVASCDVPSADLR